MNQLTERKRLRREYLRKKSSAYARIICFQVLAVIAGLIVLVCCSLINTGIWMGDGYRNSEAIPAIARFCIGGLTVVCAYVALRSQYDVIRIKLKEVDSLPVTASALPAEEILVRATNEPPVAQSAVLLRAAQAGHEAPKEELLRVSRGE